MWALESLLPPPPGLLPHLPQCLLNFQIPSGKLCSAFCILIVFSLAPDEQLGLFLDGGPAREFLAESVHMKGPGEVGLVW